MDLLWDPVCPLWEGGGGLPRFRSVWTPEPAVAPCWAKRPSGEKRVCASADDCPALFLEDLPGARLQTVSPRTAPGAAGGIPPPGAGLCPWSPVASWAGENLSWLGWQADPLTAVPTTRTCLLRGPLPQSSAPQPAHLWPRKAGTGRGGNRRRKDALT